MTDDVGAGDTDSEEDVEHGAAEAGRETHYRGEDLEGREEEEGKKEERSWGEESTHCDTHVGYEICEGVSHCEDRDTDDGIRQSEDGTKSLYQERGSRLIWTTIGWRV